MIDFPLVIEPPDIIIVELLESLPGRPISGERLVRPDGTISLGFYGDVHVRGLTPNQVTAKVVHLLRNHLTDKSLGLRIFAHGDKLEPFHPPGTKVRGDIVLPRDDRPAEKPDVEPADKATPFNLDPPPATQPTEPAAAKSPSTDRPQANRTARRSRSERRQRDTSGQPRKVKVANLPRQQAGAAAPAKVEEQEPPMEMVQDVFEYLDPVNTSRVFGDIACYNSRYYQVLGDVGTPGRLPFTGKETVLDALTYAGGLIPTAEPTDIHLYRPDRGGKPIKDYQIDRAAILRGEKRANLQVFPDDRLIVGRNAVVQKTIEIDRAMAAVNSVLNSSLQHSFTVRSMGATAGEQNGTTQATRDRSFRKLFDLLWNLPGGKADNLDINKFLEAVPVQP